MVGNRPKTVDGFALGDLVEIRSAEEILARLDSRGEHDSLQFMPEMLQYCGRTFRIGAAADLWIRRVTIGCVALLALIAGIMVVPPGITSPRQDIAR